MDRTIIPLCSGVHVTLEAEADRLIVESLAGIFSHAAKSDILTRSKQRVRYSREVYVQHLWLDLGDAPGQHDTIPFGPDASVRQGWFHKRANLGMLHLNSTYKTASVMERHRGVTMWDLRTSWPETFPVKVGHLPRALRRRTPGTGSSRTARRPLD